MKVWVDHMAKSSALMSYNVFTFPNEAQMQLHVKIWEEHGPLMFEQLKASGCLAYQANITNIRSRFRKSRTMRKPSPWFQDDVRRNEDGRASCSVVSVAGA
jgi:hypothetical protein